MVANRSNISSLSSTAFRASVAARHFVKVRTVRSDECANFRKRGVRRHRVVVPKLNDFESCLCSQITRQTLLDENQLVLHCVNPTHQMCCQCCSDTSDVER